MKSLFPMTFLVLCSSLALVAPAMAASHSSQKPALKQAKELMAGVCSSGATTGVCSPCPSFVDGDSNDKMTLEAVTYGKFLDTRNTYALLDLSGCEAHDNNFGGSVLLRWLGLTRWDFVKYLPGLRSTDCLKFPARTGRETLLCRGEFSGMGYAYTTFLQVDLSNYPAGNSDEPNEGSLVSLNDNNGSCLAVGISQSFSSWKQLKLNADAWPDLRIQVRSGSGKTDTCAVATTLNLPTRAYTLEYTWDGASFTPTPAAKTALKALERDANAVRR